MKKLMLFTACTVLSITSTTHADTTHADTTHANTTHASTSHADTSFNVVDFINQNTSNYYKAEKANVDSGCQLRNPFTGNCTLFWTEYNEYFITRGDVYNYPPGTKPGTKFVTDAVVIPIACRIVRHTRQYATNPDSTSSGFKTGDREYNAIYNVEFPWYLIRDNKVHYKEFYIENYFFTTKFVSGNRDNDALADEFCNKEITAKLLSLEGTEIPEELTLTR